MRSGAAPIEREFVNSLIRKTFPLTSGTASPILRSALTIRWGSASLFWLRTERRQRLWLALRMMVGRISRLVHGTAIIAAMVAAVIITFLPASPDSRAARGHLALPATAHQSDVPAHPAAAAPDDAVGGAAASDAPPPPGHDFERVVQAKNGDTFIKLMLDAGVPSDDAHAAVSAMNKVYDPRGLRPGQRITVAFRPKSAADDPLFLGFRFDPNVERAIRVDREADGFTAEAVDRDLDTRTARVSGSIDANLYSAVTAAGLTPQIMAQLIRLFSWDVDFQRDIRPGDRFDMMIESMHAPDGHVAGFGEILYAELTLSGVKHRLYRFESDRYGVAYYDDKGQSARKALLKTPIDGARLSSGYGVRMHPILGYTRMHRGIDFAAPTGTPIYAAGRGVIQKLGRVRGYGNYIRIGHTDRYATAYAHMSRFARGLRIGSHVKQGDIIGYVGATGEATGPHLHYEVLVDASQVNPIKVKLPSGYMLAGKDLAAFRTAQREIKTQLATVDPVTRVSMR